MRILTLMAMLVAVLSVAARETIEVYNYGLDGYSESSRLQQVAAVQRTCTIPDVRDIGGGTKFRISYGDGWDAEMRGAFEYVCRVWEETLNCTPKVGHKKKRNEI